MREVLQGLGFVFIVLFVLISLIAIINLVVGPVPDYSMWESTKCVLISVREGQPVYECVGIPR